MCAIMMDHRDSTSMVKCLVLDGEIGHVAAIGRYPRPYLVSPSRSKDFFMRHIRHLLCYL